MYVMDKLSKWENYLYLVEFAYNSGNQSSLGMIQFEELYGKRFQTLVNWDILVNRLTLVQEMIKEMEYDIVMTMQNLKTS